MPLCAVYKPSSAEHWKVEPSFREERVKKTLQIECMRLQKILTLIFNVIVDIL